MSMESVSCVSIAPLLVHLTSSHFIYYLDSFKNPTDLRWYENKLLVVYEKGVGIIDVDLYHLKAAIYKFLLNKNNFTERILEGRDSSITLACVAVSFTNGYPQIQNVSQDDIESLYYTCICENN